MFITILLIIVALIGYLSMRDWIYNRRLSSKAVQKILNQVSQYLSLGNFLGAKKHLTPLIETEKGGKQAALFEIQVLRGTHEWEMAYLKATKASRDYPEELLFRLEEGKIALKISMPKEALEAFQVCAPILRTEEDFFSFASALFHAGQSLACLEMLEPWLKGSQNGELVALAADAYFEQKQFHLAIPLYIQAIAFGWKTHQVFVQLAHAQRRLGNLSEAEKIFRSLLEKDSGDLVATLGLGLCLQERGQHHKALLIYQSGKAWEMKDPELLKQAAHAALRIKKYFYAETYFLESIQKESPSPQLWTYYGYTLERQKKWQEAEQTYLKMTQLFPSDPQGYLALAWLYGVGFSVSLTQAQSINYAHIALKLKNDLISWEILSAVEARSGNFKKAMQIQEALSLYDLDKKARLRRGEALRKLRHNLPLEEIHVVKGLVA